MYTTQIRKIRLSTQFLKGQNHLGGGLVPQGTLGVGWGDVGSASSEPLVPAGRAERRRLFTGVTDRRWVGEGALGVGWLPQGTLGVGWVVLRYSDTDSGTDSGAACLRRPYGVCTVSVRCLVNTSRT